MVAILRAFLGPTIGRPSRAFPTEAKTTGEGEMKGQVVPMNDKPMMVRIERTIDAKPQAVYRAWLDPHMVQQWMAPGGLEVTRVEIEERVGGPYRIWQGNAGNEAGGFECELLELVPNQRIVFRWGFVGPERTAGPMFDSVLTVTVQETINGSTLLTLVHERLEELSQAMPDVAEMVGPGWEMVIGRMVDVFEAKA
jgi:uncharacterized protein YndB with AHSA1/START domain